MCLDGYSIVFSTLFSAGCCPVFGDLLPQICLKLLCHFTGMDQHPGSILVQVAFLSLVQMCSQYLIYILIHSNSCHHLIYTLRSLKLPVALECKLNRNMPNNDTLAILDCLEPIFGFQDWLTTFPTVFGAIMIHVTKGFS